MIAELAVVATMATCSWDQPGASPFKRPAVEALKSYRFSDKDRKSLRERMLKYSYDDVVVIKKDSIVGLKGEEYGDLRAMHFSNKVCGKVSMSKWKPDQQEVGLVYCASTSCIIVPTVCNNVSLVTRLTKITKFSLPPTTIGEGGIYGQPRSLESPLTAEQLLEPTLYYLPPAKVGVLQVDVPIKEIYTTEYRSYPAFSYPPVYLTSSYGPIPTVTNPPAPPFPIFPPAPGVPEPSTIALAVLGLLGVAYAQRRSNRHRQ